MPYATFADAEGLYGTSALEAMLPRVEGKDAAEVLAASLLSAQAVVDSHLRAAGYLVPVDLEALRPVDAPLAQQLVHAAAIVALRQASAGAGDVPEQLTVEYGEVLEWLKSLPSGLPLERPVPATLGETFGVARPRATPEISGELFRRVSGFGGG